MLPAPSLFAVLMTGSSTLAVDTCGPDLEYAPLLIQRIEKLEPLNFAEIVAELTPDALGQLKQVTGE